jgi:hypothetical protein
MQTHAPIFVCSLGDLPCVGGIRWPARDKKNCAVVDGLAYVNKRNDVLVRPDVSKEQNNPLCIGHIEAYSRIVAGQHGGIVVDEMSVRDDEVTFLSQGWVTLERFGLPILAEMYDAAD